MLHLISKTKSLHPVSPGVIAAVLAQILIGNILGAGLLQMIV